MPELPEVETVRRGLLPALDGATIVAAKATRPDLRFPFPPDLEARLTGSQIVSLSRRAKYLLLSTDRADTFILHLGMSGSYRVETASTRFTPGVFAHERSTARAHDHLILDVEGGQAGASQIIYNDPRRFGFVLHARTCALSAHPMIAGLGPEPTGNTLSPDILAGALSGKKTPLKAALLDQRVISGLGNIYVCEALSRAKLSPRRQAGSLVKKDGTPTTRLVRLTACIRQVIAEAIEAGGSSLRDHRQTDGSMGYFQHSFRVYDREHAPCPNAPCPGTVRRIVQSGRSTFFCPTCQR